MPSLTHPRCGHNAGAAARSSGKPAPSQRGSARASVLLEAEFEVMESGSTATKTYHVVLHGVPSTPGKGVLEFYLKTGSVRRRFDTKNRMPSHRIKLDAASCLLSAQPSIDAVSCLLSAQPAAGRVQIVHLAKKTYTLQSKNAQMLETWAAALSEQIGQEPVAPIGEREASIRAPGPPAAPVVADSTAAQEAADQPASL